MKTGIVRLSLMAGLLMVASLSAQAQVEEAWLTLFNGSHDGDDWAFDVATDSVGNIYVAGFCNNRAWSNADYGVVKYSPSGEQLWSAEYDGPVHGDDEARAVAVDRRGNVYVTGYSTADNVDYTTIKYNPEGAQQWVARYNGTADRDDRPKAMAIDADGNVLITGSSCGVGGNCDIVTIEYDSLGRVQWLARYNGPAGGSDAGMSMALDSRGNVYVTGYSEGSVTAEDFVTLKYTSTGQLLWEARYNSPYNLADKATFICISHDDFIFVTGKSANSNGDFDFLTIKYDAAGHCRWVARYDGSEHSDDGAMGAVPGTDGCVYVLGCTVNIGTSMDYCTIKYNSRGAQQWVAFYDGPGNLNDGPQEIVVDSQENIYVTGTSDGLNPPNADLCTLKYDSSGNQLWVARHNGSRNTADGGQSLILTLDGRVVVTGVALQLITGADFCTIEYVQSSGTEIPLPQVIAPQDLSLSPPTPNPFNSTTILSYKLPFADRVQLTVWDTAGRLVATLVEGRQEKGMHEITFKGADLASGVYFVQLKAGRFENVRKLLLLR
jgi:uncharacterized delta-60 repeat protein